MLQLRGFDPADRGAIIRLLGGGRGPDYGLRKAMIFDWQYFQNPHADGGPPFEVGTVGGEIVAVFGFSPARIRFRGRPGRGCWTADSYVAPAHRGKGFSTALRKVAMTRAPVMMVYGNSDIADSAQERLGWRLHGDIHLLFLSVSERGLRGVVKNLSTRLARARHSATRSRPTPVDCDLGSNFDAEVDDLWRRCAPGYWSAVERDAAYLNWKYRRHPIHRYPCYSARENGRLRGLMVARHHPVESVIVDYCGPADDGDLMFGLAQAATADLIRRGTVRVRCETTHRPMVSALKRLGMHEGRRPSRFRVRAEGADPEILRDWFLMTGDSDNDLVPVD